MNNTETKYLIFMATTKLHRLQNHGKQVYTHGTRIHTHRWLQCTTTPWNQAFSSRLSTLNTKQINKNILGFSNLKSDFSSVFSFYFYFLRMYHIRPHIHAHFHNKYTGSNRINTCAYVCIKQTHPPTPSLNIHAWWRELGEGSFNLLQKNSPPPKQSSKEPGKNLGYHFCTYLHNSKWPVATKRYLMTC